MGGESFRWARVYGMKKPLRYRSLATVFWLLGMLVACVNGPLAPLEPVPGNGPGGKPMPTSTDIAAGLPATPSTQLVYPVTARGKLSDDYDRKTLDDPYRGREDLNSQATRDWVAAQNKVSQPRLETIPQRAWVKQRLQQLWSYERFNTPGKEGGRYFFTHNDGKQNQSVLFVTDSLDAPARVLVDPNVARADATVALAEFSPSPQCDVVAYAFSDGGTDWQLWRFRRVSDATDLPDTLRFTKFWGVSWARDGACVYYSRYPSLPNGRGDDSGRPVVYFHKLGEPQESDRLIYAVTDHPTRAPSARVTDDGHYLVITLIDGYDRNGVSVLDLRRPGATVSPLFYSWDALCRFIGSDGDLLYFHT